MASKVTFWRIRTIDGNPATQTPAPVFNTDAARITLATLYSASDYPATPAPEPEPITPLTSDDIRAGLIAAYAIIETAKTAIACDTTTPASFYSSMNRAAKMIDQQIRANLAE